MNAQRQTNTFTSGMNMDLDYSLIDSKQYKYAENIRVLMNEANSTGALQNIEGFTRVNPSRYFYNENIVHIDTIRDWAIVFTEQNDLFNIYRIDFSKNDLEPEVTLIAGELALDIPKYDNHYCVSSVCVWESSNIVKIYWADGQHQIRLLNVATTYSNLDINTLTIIPDNTLPPLLLKEIGNGNLKSGKYQYAYQVFNSRGVESSISVLSSIITVTNDGNSSTESSGKSIVLQTTLQSGLEKARIIRIQYTSNTSVPLIYVLDEVNISGNILQYEDIGGEFSNELTVDEFNALVSYDFSPKILESKNNILFAANITENTWDVEYDARAYRFDKTGKALLKSNSGNDLTIDIEDRNSLINVDKEHDCICPYNIDTTSEYKYVKNETGSYVLGGKGPNVSYQFITTDLIGDGTEVSEYSNGLLENTFKLQPDEMYLDKLPVYAIDNGTKSSIGNIELSAKNRIPNYKDSEIDTKVRGYQRDEIYRFGIVFYNKQNLPSTVHWIADIRMPKITDNGFKTFTTGKNVILGNNTKKLSMTLHPLGVSFTVSNLPDGITAYEIVRCQRTIVDRSIITQGVVSQVCRYGTLTAEASDNQLVALPYTAMSKRHSVQISAGGKGTGGNMGGLQYNYYFEFGKYVDDKHYLLISPDICINREAVNELLKNGEKIEVLYGLTSKFKNIPLTDFSTGGFTYTQVFTSPKTIKDVDGKFYTEENKLAYQVNGKYADNRTYFNISQDKNNSALLGKYYFDNTNNSGKEFTINGIKVANNTNAIDKTGEEWKAKGTAIDNVIYYNWVENYLKKDSNYVSSNANNVTKLGPHGVCAIMNVDFSNYTYPTNADNTFEIPLVNIKRNVTPYGGYTYSSRQNSTYISTGMSATESTTLNTFGGDTYVCMLDYANTMFSFNDENPSPSNAKHSAYFGIYFPVETTANLDLRNDDFRTSNTYQESIDYANTWVQNDIIQIQDLYTQSKPLYSYNDVYSSQPNVQTFSVKSRYSIDNLNTDTRVIASEPKTNLEVTDSWTKFKVANFLDVDSRFGSINCMRLFKNYLLYWQTDAFGALSVNERSLIKDNNISELTLGTGGVLARYDYFTTLNGMKANQLRNDTQSDTTVYWYDADRNEICGFNGQTQSVAKVKGVQSYLNDKKEILSNDPQGYYDKKYNDVLFTLEDKTLVFNEQLGVFTSFYTFKPDWVVEFSDKLFMYNNLNLFKYNTGDNRNLFDDQSKISYIQFVVNEGYPQTKTFDNVEYGGDFTYKTNFFKIWFETKRQRSFELTNTDIDYREDTYKFCVPRSDRELNVIEELVNKSYRDRMKGKYLVCNYKYDCNNGNTFKVPYISTAYRKSLI